MSDTAPTPTSTPEPSTDAPHDEGESHPRGTMVITLLFLAGTAAVWLWTFTTLISRG